VELCDLFVLGFRVGYVRRGRDGEGRNIEVKKKNGWVYGPIPRGPRYLGGGGEKSMPGRGSGSERAGV